MARNKCCQTMLISQRVVFMLLLTSLQWIRGNVANTTVTTKPSTTAATSITSVVTLSTVTPHSATSTVTEYDTRSSSSALPETPLSPTTQQLDYSTEDTTQSFTSDNRMSSVSETPTTASSLSHSYAHTTDTKSSEAASNSFTTTTYDVSFSTMVITSDTTNDTQTISVTAPINNTTSAMSLSTSNNAKTGLMTSIQTTRLHSSPTGSSAETRRPTQENHSNGAVIFGAIVGAVLGCALIGLVGYFMCRKRKSEGFSHQRLYDDTRNDPVLRLDNAPASYGDSFADMSYYNPTMDNETTAQNSDVPPYDAIPMDDMTISPQKL